MATSRGDAEGGGPGGESECLGAVAAVISGCMGTRSPRCRRQGLRDEVVLGGAAWARMRFRRPRQTGRCL